MQSANLMIDKIRTDGDTQSRAHIDEEVVAEYAAHYQNDTALPPVLVFYDGSDYWLAEGFHRLHAALRAGLTELPFEVRKGTREDAAWASAGANQAHGLRRTNADKRRAVEMALALKADLSDRAIAEHVGVGHPMVADVRDQLEESSTCPTPTIRRGLDGKQYPAPARAPRPRADDEADDGPAPVTPPPERRQKRRDTVPSRMRQAIYVLRREVEIIKERHWSGVARDDVRDAIMEVVRFVDEE